MKTLLIAAGAVALMTGAAYAQTPAEEPATTDTMPAASETAPAPSSTMATAPGGIPTANVQTVTNGPVPDTAENRAKYGQPMSNAGKKTAPVGN